MGVTLRFSRAQFFENSADGASGSGGGIFSTAGNIFVNNRSRITNNIANRAGGGVEIVDGRLDVINSSLIENSAGTRSPDAASPGNGGAVHVSGNSTTTNFRDSIISDNAAASEGGGLWNQSGSLMFISDTRIATNTAAGDDADNGGGGVFNNGGNLRIINGDFNSNSATGLSGSGGGIFSTDGRVLISNTDIFGGIANRAGGGLEIIDGYTRLEFSTVTSNVAGGNGANPGNGGGVHISGANSRFVAINSKFSSNEAANDGGAIWNQTGSTMVLRNDVTRFGTELDLNVSGSNGGGIYNKGRLNVQDTVFDRNTAIIDGGGIFTTADGESFLTRTTVVDNIAAGLGGGLANFGNLAVVDSVFENNEANDGGAIAAVDGNTSQARNTFTGNSPNDISRA